ncbi:MAG: hypothetical protein IJB96_06125 [Lachnospira sp.]|nr:hypothetical protein [Lachnospira sp.]
MREYNNNVVDNQELGDYVDIYKQPVPHGNQAQGDYGQTSGDNPTQSWYAYNNPSINTNYYNPSMNANYNNPSMNPGYRNPSVNQNYNNSNVVNNVTSENIVMGIMGALLFAFAGGLLHFIVYQLGFIAYICGLLIFYLPFLGYTKFAKGASLKGFIISIIISIITVYVSEYTSLAFLIYNEYKTMFDITFMDAFLSVSDFISEVPEIKASFVRDLFILYVTGAITVVSMLKKK